MEEEMELSTIERLNKERDHIEDILYLLEKGEVERAIEILKRDKKTLEESVAQK